MITVIFQINNNQTGFDSTSFRPKHTKRQRSMRSGEICMFDSSPFAQVSVETGFIPWLDYLRRFYLRYDRTGKLCQDRRREVEPRTNTGSTFVTLKKRRYKRQTICHPLRNGWQFNPRWEAASIRNDKHSNDKHSNIQTFKHSNKK